MRTSLRSHSSFPFPLLVSMQTIAIVSIDALLAARKIMLFVSY